MELKVEINKTIVEVQKVFPFDDYIDETFYWECYAILKELRKFISGFENKRLLDIGSSPMDKTGVFQLLGFQCYAVDDLSDPWHQRGNNIQTIKNYADSLDISIFHQQENERTIPFEPNNFDVVCSFAVIEHLLEVPRNLLNTMRSFLRTNGFLIITMPNSVNLRKRLSVLVGQTNYVPVDQLFYSIHNWRGHVREYTLSETVYICKESGCDVVSSTSFESLTYKKLSSPLRELYLLLGIILPTFRSGLLLICRKPDSWKPVEDEPETFRKVLAKAVPKGVA